MAAVRCAYPRPVAALWGSSRRADGLRSHRYGAKVWGGLFTNGPIARSVRDAALMLDVMAGAPRPAQSFQSAIERRPNKLRLATLNRSALGPIEADTLASFETACAAFRAMGHQLEPVDVDPAARLSECFGSVVAASIAAVPFKDSELIDPIVRVFYEAGKKMSAPQYVGALLEMHNTSRAIVQSLMPYDALLTPTLARPAMLIGELPSAAPACPSGFR